MELNGEKRHAINLAGEMAVGISHEIRNPITTVRGFLQLFSSKSEFMRYKEYFTLMIDELDKVNSIIKEFLLMAKNKKVDLRMRDLNMIVKDLYPLIQADALISDKNVDVELGVIPALLLDEHEIRRLILHLASNGLEAMFPGGKLTIKTYKDGEGVVLSVQDHGYEIAQDILEKIGTPFFTTKDYGTGLGLAVCNSIAARHNGVIQVETSPSGTTVFVRFLNAR
jgi:signal transduction histidine kinase